ncbi:hypothetical protein ACFS7Z_08475 [Pontibacter toksunensis]|uniref:Uncharacterized protein n=1 Tax=Pontibacter toksunensis TaxID=1332631 RepID=A0ABW6BRD6_9BACT
MSRFTIRRLQIEDVLDFGKVDKGYKFTDIFVYDNDYLVNYIIPRTGVCFRSLDDFLKVGNPKRINFDTLNEFALDSVLNYLAKNETYVSGAIPWSLDNITYNKNIGHMCEANFEEFEFKFSEELIRINNEKLLQLELKGDKAYWE